MKWWVWVAVGLFVLWCASDQRRTQASCDAGSSYACWQANNNDNASHNWHY